MNYTNDQDASCSADVLEGYTVIEAKGQRFLVPDFAVHDLRVKLETEAKRKELGADTNTNSVCHIPCPS
jgi:hypothetical protein